MKNISFYKVIQKEVSSFFSTVSKTSENAYLVLFSLYVSLYLFLKVAWNTEVFTIEGVVRFGLLSLVMWGSAIYLIFVIVSWKNLWKKSILLIFVAAIVLACTYLLSKKMSTNLYGAVMDVFFCVMAFGKKYQKLLKCILWCTVGTLLIALIGMFAGFTFDVVKPENIHPGHSLGIEYPNNWGYLVFLVLVLLWYLYLRHKPLITFALFWAVSAFMFFYVYCRTISFLTIGFPVCALFIDLLEKRIDRKAESSSGVKKKIIWEGIITVIPVFAFAFMLLCSMNVEWMHEHFYYTWFHNFAMRFVQGGLYFRTYGFPLIGNPYKGNVTTYMNVNGDFLEVGILDSSFAAYMIMRGLIWIAYTLIWLCLAHWKAVKKRDYGIILISSFMLLFAMLERPGLEAWYNFILLYPLARVVSKSGTVKVFEFYPSDNTDQEETDIDDSTTKFETSMIRDEHVADEEL